MANRNTDDAVAETAVRISHRLDQRLTESALEIQRVLIGEYPELAADPSLTRLLHDTLMGNVDTYFSAIRHDIPVADVRAPTIALEHARRLAQRDVAVDVLVRGYRMGHSMALQVVLDEIRAAGLDPELQLDVFARMSTLMFGYIDHMSQQVVAAYQAEREQWLESRTAVRALRVREILAGGELDVDALSTALRYPLRRTHLALVAWDRPDRRTGPDELLNRVADVLVGRSAALVVPVDDVTSWAWLPLPADAADDLLARIGAAVESAAGTARLAVGAPLPGIDGFRRSHRQALAGHAVALAAGEAGAAGPRMLAAADPGLSAAALLGGDVPAARAWIGETLGPLAGVTESDERLRETLRVFLGTGGSFKAAGEALHLHVNTVKYRVARAIERRGRPIADDRLDVEIALLLCHWYRAAVLG